MAIKEVIDSAISNVRNVASGIFNSTQDNKGFIQQGRLTAQPVQSFVKGLGKSPVSQFGQTLGSTMAAPLLSKTYQPIQNDLSSNISQALKMASQAKTPAEKQRWMSLAGSSQNLGSNIANQYQSQYNKKPLQIVGEGIGTAATLIGGPKLAPKTAITTALIGGGINKLTGGSFGEGFGTALGYAPAFQGVATLTNPLLSKAMSFTPVKGAIAQRGAAGLANVVQGITQDISTGQKTTPLTAGIDLAYGLIGGKSQFDTPNVKVKGMFKDAKKIDEYTAEEIANLKVKFDKGNYTHKDIVDLERISEKFMGKETRKGYKFKDPKFKIQQLMDEVERQYIPNLSMGIVGKQEPIKTEGDIKTLYHGTDTAFEKFDLTKQSEGNLGKGIYLTDSDYAAKIYGKEAVRNKQLAKGDLYGKTKNGVVLSIDIYPNAKIKKLDYQPTYSEAQKIKEQGFDGITYPDQTLQNTMGMSSTKAKTNATVIFNENIIKIKQSQISPEVKPTLKIKPPVEPKKVEVPIELNNTKMTNVGDVEKILYKTPTGKMMTTEQVAKLNPLQRLELKVSQLVSKGLESDSDIVRNISRSAQGFLGDLGKSRDIQMKTGQFRGGIDYANQMAGDLQQYAYSKANKDSLSRIHSVLDPEISNLKVKESQLTPEEKDLLSVFRTISDFINDTNYKNGFISKEQWAKNKGGKYIARAYEEYDFPPEMSDFIKRSKKLDLNPFKQREDVTDWMKENAIKDPSYLMSKRLQQTLFNDEVSRMYSWLKDTPYVSKEAKNGFVQLSDHKAYGDLAGKYIRKDVLDDIQGLHFTNDTAQKMYDVLGAFDRNPLRQGYKKIFTVFNPAVRLGNKTSNFVFTMLNGLNPVTFAKNQGWAKQQINSKSPVYRQLIQSGTIGTDFTKADIVSYAEKLSRGQTDPTVLKKLRETVENFTNGYGKADDIAKLAAYKTWIDKGVDPQQALYNVMRGYQNYRITGWFYDVASKLPILGNPFARFSGELLRLTKNWAIDHPVALASTLVGWKLLSDVTSRLSGETIEDRQTREQRVGANRIPFTNISLELQTPWGAVNASRLIGMSAYNPVGGATMLDDAGKLSPLDFSQKGMVTDPVIGPLIAILRDKDFRGKSIKDPEMSKYIGSLLTGDEQRLNQIKYAIRQYSPTFGNDLNDLITSIKGEKDFYGRTKTPVQGALKLVGIKVEKYGPEQAQAQREKDLSYQEYKTDSIQKQINAVDKQRLQGKIDEQTAQKRIDYLEKQKVTTQPKKLFEVRTNKLQATEPKTSIKEYSYLDDEGVRRTVDVNTVANMPENTSYEKLLKQKEAYKIASKLSGVVPPMELDSVLSKIGVSKEDAAYYKVANQADDLKKAYIQDQIQTIASQGGTHTTLINYLKDNAKKINEKSIVSSAVLTDLYNQGLITYDEKKQLTSIASGFKKVSGSKAKNPKAIKVKMGKLKAIKFKSPKKIKLSKVKPPKFKKIKVANYKTPKL